jgi:hypothetical protein
MIALFVSIYIIHEKNENMEEKMDFTYRFPTGFKLAEKLIDISQRTLDISHDDPLRGILITLQHKCQRLFAASITPT